MLGGRKMTKSVFERIDSLMKQQGKQQKEMNEYLHLGQRTYDNWKAGKSSTYLQHLDEIANYLGVTPNYLINGQESYNLLDTTEGELIDMFRSLSDSKKRFALNMVKLLLSES
jgi:transcriptional regulator with XRE-family HTH domain